VVGARTNNDANTVAGVMWNCKIMPIKAYGKNKWIAQGFDWATNNGAQIINLSGFIDEIADVDKVGAAVGNAYVQGKIVCASMGKSGDGTVVYPI
jgi:subtilisin family serine protease